MQFIVALLLGVVCINVAILVYARTATRHAEIAVRSALGAGRRRIVAQLFVEALVLTGVAAVIGVGIVALALREVDAALAQVAGPLPFWMEFSLTPGGLVDTLALAIGAAAIVGVVPALKVTGRRVQTGLKDISPGSGAGMRLGKIWTGLIVAQVAIAVAMLPAAIYHAWDATRHGVSDPGFAAHEFLTAHLAMDREANGHFADRQAEVMRRLWAVPQVAGATSAVVAPGSEPRAWIEIDGVAGPVENDDFSVAAGSATGHGVAFNHVDTDWFTVFQVPILRGRGFSAGDTATTATAAIVNRSFVDQLLPAADVLGRRFRYVGVSGDGRPEDVDFERWYEIVGVVADFPVNNMDSGTAQPKVFHAMTASVLPPVSVNVRVRSGEATAFASEMLQIAADVDPSLQLRNVRRLDALLLEDQSLFRLIASVLLLLTLSVVVLSAAGIYALMSCTVEQRRKEIGIRAALGANPRRILAAIFARALAQLGAGAAVGLAIAASLEAASGGELMANRGAIVMPLVAVFMMLVGLAAAWVPARRGLQIHPINTLRAE
jgi:putative ABC transport system permease protein